MSRARAALLACACTVSCAGSPFHGGYARPEAPLPGSKVLESFIPGHCEDPSRAEHEPRFSGVDLVETKTGKPVLVEHRQGHEQLVVENFHDQGSFWIFELVVRGDHLRRWRIPRSTFGSGTRDVGRQLTEVSRGEGFEAGLASSHLTCTLVPKASDLPP